MFRFRGQSFERARATSPTWTKRRSSAAAATISPTKASRTQGRPAARPVMRKRSPAGTGASWATRRVVSRAIASRRPRRPLRPSLRASAVTRRPKVRTPGSSTTGPWRARPATRRTRRPWSRTARPAMQSERRSTPLTQGARRAPIVTNLMHPHRPPSPRAPGVTSRREAPPRPVTPRVRGVTSPTTSSPRDARPAWDATRTNQPWPRRWRSMRSARAAMRRTRRTTWGLRPRHARAVTQTSRSSTLGDPNASRATSRTRPRTRRQSSPRARSATEPSPPQTPRPTPGPNAPSAIARTTSRRPREPRSALPATRPRSSSPQPTRAIATARRATAATSTVKRRRRRVGPVTPPSSRPRRPATRPASGATSPTRVSAEAPPRAPRATPMKRAASTNMSKVGARPVTARTALAGSRPRPRA